MPHPSPSVVIVFVYLYVRWGELRKSFTSFRQIFTLFFVAINRENTPLYASTKREGWKDQFIGKSEIFDVQRPHGVENGNHRDADVGKDSLPHGSNAESAEKQYKGLDA